MIKWISLTGTISVYNFSIQILLEMRPMVATAFATTLAPSCQKPAFSLYFEFYNTVTKTKKSAIPQPQAERQEPTRAHRTSNYLTKYERARIIGTRAMQISLNAPILVPLEGETDPLEIAEKELRSKLIPFIIRRRLPNGECEDWKVSELIDAN